MIPLIKWAGGKTQEIKYIEKMIPVYDRYFEPFLGGGALFFNLEPKQAHINDITTELVNFYKYIQNGKREIFRKELERYVEAWDKINEYMDEFGDSIIKIFNKYKTNKISGDEFIYSIEKLFKNKIVPFNGLFSEEFAINREDMQKYIEKNVIAKLNRIKKVIDVQNKFSEPEIIKNIETAFRSGFYIHFREIMNKAKKDEIKVSEERMVANYYFIREFCYGGMFRFNLEGNFNIPYGGIAYNSKDFNKKVQQLFSEPVRRLLKRTTIENMDFEKFINKHKLTTNDFIFLDPPYDSEFSEYEENPFNRDDQKRLAETLYKTKAKFILIIKETPFIRALYENKRGIKIVSFDKTYLYNVKGRNNREVKHLIIHNIKDSQKKLI